MWGLWLLAVVSTLWFVNLYNFMDGIDGIAGAQGVVGAVGLALLIGYPADPITWLLAATAGVIGYFAIGFYTAALLSATVSMLVMLGGTLLWPDEFSFRRLAKLRVPAEEEGAP